MNNAQPAAAASSSTHVPSRRPPGPLGAPARKLDPHAPSRQTPPLDMPADVTLEHSDTESGSPPFGYDGDKNQNVSPQGLRPAKSTGNLRRDPEQFTPGRAPPPVPPLGLARHKPANSPPLLSPDGTPPPWGAQAKLRGAGRTEPASDADATSRTLRNLEYKVKNLELALKSLEGGPVQALKERLHKVEAVRLPQIETQLRAAQRAGELNWIHERLHALEVGHTIAPAPLPHTHRWVQTQSGPYAIHREVLARLEVYVIFEEAEGEPEGPEPVLVTDLPRALLTALVYWCNGMSLSTDVLPLSDLWLLKEYAGQAAVRDLTIAVNTELDKLANQAMLHCLEGYGARSQAADLAKHLVKEARDPMARQQHKPAQSRNFSLNLHVAEPPPWPTNKSSLREIESSGRGGNWINEVNHACEAFNEFLKVHQLRLTDDRPLEIASMPKRIGIIKLHCTY